MNKRKYWIILFTLVMFLTGCSENYMASIYDNNKEISSDSNSFNLDVEEQSIDGQQFNAKINKIEGMDTIWTYEADDDMELDIKYLLNLKAGKVKLVLISPDNSVTNIIEEINQSDANDYAVNTMKIKKGLNRIKIVAGKNTSIEINVVISNGNFEKLGI